MTKHKPNAVSGRTELKGPALSERSESNGWDTSYEWKAVTLLGLGFGLVGLDRWIIAPLFPFMLADLGLNLQDQGNIIGALGLAWGVFAVFSGRLSDTIGHRKVLIPAVFLFSVLSGASRLATPLATLPPLPPPIPPLHRSSPPTPPTPPP